MPFLLHFLLRLMENPQCLLDLLVVLALVACMRKTRSTTLSVLEANMVLITAVFPFWLVLDLIRS